MAGANWYRPFLPTFAVKAGKILDIVAMPCKPTPEIWIKAIWASNPAVLLTPIKPSSTDYLIVRIGFSHGKGRRKAFDVWDFSFNPQVVKGGVGWTAFRIGSLAARALWWIAVADGITSFVYNWVSTAYQWSGCVLPGAAYATATAPNGQVLQTNDAGTIMLNWVHVDNHIYGAGGTGVLTTAGTNPTVGATCNQGPFPGHDTDWIAATFELVDIDTGEKFESFNTKSADGQTAYFSGFTREGGLQVTGSRNWGLLITNAPSWAQITGGIFSAYGALNKNDLLSDP